MMRPQNNAGRNKGRPMEDDISRVKSIVYEQRLIISKARRMTENSNDDYFCFLIIESLDELLSGIDEKSKELSVRECVKDRCEYFDVAPLIFPCSREMQVLLCCVSGKLREISFG